MATHREARSRALFEAARDLSNMLTNEQAVEVAQRVIGARVPRQGRRSACSDADDRLQAAATRDSAAGLDLGTAQWALDHDQPAGLGTDTLAGSAWLYLPLKAHDAHAAACWPCNPTSRACCWCPSSASSSRPSPR